MGDRIVLVSRRKHIIDFFRLEAELWGYDMLVSPVLTTIDGNTAVLICDGIDPPSELDGITAYKLIDGDDDGYGILGFPVSLERLKEIFGQAAHENVSSTDENTIYMKQGSREILYKSRFYT